MDVRISLSVSFLRDQLGAVIEQAVTNAVETVLDEMLKVVGCKFDELSKEMTAKEKENESIRKMLEISRCQMKTMRKYLSAVSAKDERHVPVNLKFGKQTVCPYRGELRLIPNTNWTRKAGDGYFNRNERAETLLSDNQIPSVGLTRTIQPHDGTAEKDQEFAVRESKETLCAAPNLHLKEHLTQVKEEHRDPQETPGECPGREGICETERSRGRSTEFLQFEPSLNMVDNTAATATIRASPQAKVEEAEMQLICIKEEPPEPVMHTLSPQPPESLSDPCCDQGGRHDEARPAGCLMGVALPTISPSTCWDGRLQTQWKVGELQALRQQRAELQRRSQLRRREREKSLPQPLLAAMERERREKTRIRVARWRAKRKMQAAGLVPSQPSAQPTQLDYRMVQTTRVHTSEALRCSQQYGSLLYSSPHCENGALYPPLQIGQEPDTLAGSEVMAVQQGTIGTDSELFQ